MKDKGGKGISFAELAQSNITGWTGKYSLTFPSDENKILWIGLSLEAIDVLSSLLNEGLVEFKPTDIMTYRIDGVVLALPVFKNVRKQTKPTWFPMVLNVL